MKKLFVALLFAGTGLFAANASADLTYVDATDDAGGNTTLADGSTLFADNGTGGSTWRQRDNAAFGSNGTVFEGVDPSPEIRTRVTGLTDGLYDVYVHFWDPTSTVENWNVSAGFSSGSLTTFTREADAQTGSIASVLSSDLSYDVAPGLMTQQSNRDNLAGFVGQATVTGGTLDVYIDDLGVGTVNDRTWYDGISYQVAAVPEPGSLAVLAMISMVAGLRRRKSIA